MSLLDLPLVQDIVDTLKNQVEILQTRTARSTVSTTAGESLSTRSSDSTVSVSSRSSVSVPESDCVSKEVSVGFVEACMSYMYIKIYVHMT